MKELSIEEKAKAYDKVLEWATEAHKVCDGMLKEDLEHLFPELKESEDERMIQYFKDLAPFDKADELYEKYGFSHKDAISWLEKQGEQKAEWSKEDERNFDIIYGIIYNSCNAEDASRLIAWLKSFKDRVQPQPNQEWSEEDRITRNALIKLVEKLYESSIYELDKNRLLDWLKSLRPQSTWKPSDKQLVALRIAIGDEQGSDCCDILRSLLKDLSNRFKA